MGTKPELLSLTEIAKELRALSSIADDLANQIEAVVGAVDLDALRKLLCGVENLQQRPDPPLAHKVNCAYRESNGKASCNCSRKPSVETISAIHNSMSSGGVPRKTKRSMTPDEKSLIRQQYITRLGEVDPKSPAAKQIRDGLAKEYHCTSRQVTSLVTVPSGHLTKMREIRDQMAQDVRTMRTGS